METTTDPAEQRPSDEPVETKKSFRFWAVIITLCFLSVMSALENTVVTTFLPYISDQLDLGEDYVWITNVFFLPAAVAQPLFGQLANVFGRRSITLAVCVLFILGSGLCGGANNKATIITGRAIQGMGGGGLNTLPNIIVSDLVPLRERGKYVAWFLTTYFIGTAIGPWIGGASMLMVFFFLKVKYDKEMSVRERLRRIDYIGNALLIASSVSILYALSYGGSLYPWSNWRILTSLLVGFAGLGIFTFFEGTKDARDPVVPLHLFTNRTSSIIMATTFLASALLYWVYFFMPIYFQAVLGSFPARAGFQVLPSIVITVPCSILAVLLLTKLGKYKAIHLAGFAFLTLGIGQFALLDTDSSTAEWIIFQLINAVGNGILMNSLLPACQAALPEEDQAQTTAVWSSIRSFGSIWGVIIPAAIFNNYFDQYVGRIDDAAVRERFSSVDAYANANSDFLRQFSGAALLDIRNVYSVVLQRVWQISIAFAGVCVVLTMFEREIALRTELETAYGLDEKAEASSSDVEKSRSGNSSKGSI